MIRRQTVRSVVTVFIALGFVLILMWLSLLYAPLIKHEQGYQYTVKSGKTLNAVVNDLYVKGIIKHPFFVKLLLRLRGHGFDLKAGEYYFPKGTTLSAMLHQMVTGSGVVYHVFTIIPGWTFNDIRNALAKDDSVNHSIERLTDPQVMQVLGQANSSAEGQFFPESYYFTRGVTDIVLLKRAFDTMQTKLAIIWKERAVGLPYRNASDVLIMASMIEKEAYFNDERPMIASVLLNRLEKNMLLQVDPTVIYGLGSRYTGQIRKEDLLNNSPFNTYLYKGLPPSPIAMPGLYSMLAAVHPAKTLYLYYVARNNKSHQFSETYVEHQMAVTAANKMDLSFFNESLLRYHLLRILMSYQHALL